MSYYRQRNDFVTPTLSAQNKMIEGAAYAQQRKSDAKFSNALAGAYQGQRTDMAGMSPEQIKMLQTAWNQADEQKKEEIRTNVMILDEALKRISPQNYNRIAGSIQKVLPDMPIPRTYGDFEAVRPAFEENLAITKASIGMTEQPEYRNVGPGARVVDMGSGDVVYEAPMVETPAQKAARISSETQTKLALAREAREVKAAEKAAAQESEAKESAKTHAKDVINLAKSIIDDKNNLEWFSGKTGRGPTLRTEMVSFKKKLGRLTGLLALENRHLLTGVLSDSDIALLHNIATSLAEGGEYDENRQELARIINKLEGGVGVELTDYSDPASGAVDWSDMPND